MKITSLVNWGFALITIGFITSEAHAKRTYWEDRTGHGVGCYVGVGGLDMAGESCQTSAAACASCGGLWTGNPGVLLLNQAKEQLMPASNGNGGSKPVPIVCSKVEFDGVTCVKCNDPSPATCDFKSPKK